MAVQESVTRPAPFVEKLGVNLAENVLAQQGVPVVTQGLGALQQAAQASRTARTAAGSPRVCQSDCKSRRCSEIEAVSEAGEEETESRRRQSRDGSPRSQPRLR